MTKEEAESWLMVYAKMGDTKGKGKEPEAMGYYLLLH